MRLFRNVLIMRRKIIEFLVKLIPYLPSAKALPSYKLLAEFEYGVAGTIDISEWRVHGVFGYWNDEKNFSAFKISSKKKVGMER